jgi:hypothetical protein
LRSKTDSAKSSAAAAAAAAARQYRGVTHVKALSGFTGCFVSACSAGVVKVWQLPHSARYNNGTARLRCAICDIYLIIPLKIMCTHAYITFIVH